MSNTLPSYCHHGDAALMSASSLQVRQQPSFYFAAKPF